MSNNEPDFDNLPSNALFALNVGYDTEVRPINIELVITPDSIEVTPDLEFSNGDDFIAYMKAISSALFEAQRKITSDLSLKIEFEIDNSKQVSGNLVVPLRVRGLPKTDTTQSFTFEPLENGKFKVKYSIKTSVKMVDKQAQIKLAVAMCRVGMIALGKMIQG